MFANSLNAKIIRAKKGSIIASAFLVWLSAVALPTRWWAFAYVFFFPITFILLFPIGLHLLESSEGKEAYLAKLSHKQEVKRLRREVQKAKRARDNEIRKITNQRTGHIGSHLSYDFAKGIVFINGKAYSFKDIEGAKINDVQSSVVTKQKYKYSTFLGGPLFAQQELISETKDVCTHLGVVATMCGFKVEIVLINKTTDIDSLAYSSAKVTAQHIFDKLQELAQTPVPTNYLPPEAEPSVQELNRQLAKATSAYNAALGESTIKKTI